MCHAFCSTVKYNLLNVYMPIRKQHNLSISSKDVFDAQHDDDDDDYDYGENVVNTGNPEKWRRFLMLKFSENVSVP